MSGVLPFGRRDVDGVIEDFAAEHQIDPDLLRAVVQVESAGHAFVDGRPVIRLEVHLLQSEAGRSGKDRRRLDGAFRRTGAKTWEGHDVDLGTGWQPLHGQPGEPLAASQAREWAALALARQILGRERADRSASWGVGQVLGRNHAAAGYPSAAAMADDFGRGEAQQVAGMLAFIAADKGGRMLDALQAGNIQGFVADYNGTGQIPYYTDAITRALTRIRRRAVQA